jgi:hypothetical protein
MLLEFSESYLRMSIASIYLSLRPYKQDYPLILINFLMMKSAARIQHMIESIYSSFVELSALLFSFNIFKAYLKSYLYKVGISSFEKINISSSVEGFSFNPKTSMNNGIKSMLTISSPTSRKKGVYVPKCMSMLEG